MLRNLEDNINVKCKDCTWWKKSTRQCLYNAYSGYTSPDYSCKRADKRYVEESSLSEKSGHLLSQDMDLNICEHRDHPSEKELSDAIESILYHDNKDEHETNVALSIAVESMRCLLRQIRNQK